MDMDVGLTSVSDGECCEDSHNVNSGLRCDMGVVGNGGGKLKRSSSAPMINQLLPQGNGSSGPQMPSMSNSSLGFNRDTSNSEMNCMQPRARRLSANFGPVSPLSPGSNRTVVRMRVCQLREEEGMDIVNREAAHERTVHSSLQVAQTLSQSWEDLALNEERKSFSSQAPVSQSKKDYSDQLSLTITSSSNAISTQSSCSASPTRVGRQCFSPSLQQPVRNYSFCPSPSPTKKTFTTRRSLSPIPLRPSPLGGIKRKWDLEESFITPNKRLSTDKCGGGLLIAHPHSLESTPSPLGGGGSLGSVGTPESVCSSSGSPGPPPRSYSPAPTPDPLSPSLSSGMTPHAPSYSLMGEHPDDQEMLLLRRRRRRQPSFGSSSKPPSSIGEGSDGSSDAMMTEDASTGTAATTTISSSSSSSSAAAAASSSSSSQQQQDLKTFQEMDLSESLPQETLNI